MRRMTILANTDMHSVTVVGIDVGGKRKGFHAVALCDDKFIDIKAHDDPAVIVNWCLDHEAAVVGVDAPCKWSRTGTSRLAERELAKKGIHCFATPTYQVAKGSKTGFYEWILNGQSLYHMLLCKYLLFNGDRTDSHTCIETFPHAVTCAIEGKVVITRPRVRVRREALQRVGYDDSKLPNIDFVDAALCAAAAEAYLKDSYDSYGDYAEGFIVVPKGLR